MNKRNREDLGTKAAFVLVLSLIVMIMGMCGLFAWGFAEFIMWMVSQ